MSWIRRHDLAVFVFLAFALSWWPWLFTATNPDSAPMIPWGPVVAAFVVLGITRGRAGMKRLLADMFRWRVGARWYAVAFLLPIGITILATVLNAALGAPDVTAALLEAPAQFLPALVLITLVNGAFTEEPGWRGFHLPRLQSTRSPLVASLIIGVIWWAWHAPLMISDPSGQRPPLQYLITLLAYSVLLTWVYNYTRASVLLVTLMHGTINTIASLLFPSQMGEHYGRLWWLYAALWWLAAGLVLLRTNALARPTPWPALAPPQEDPPMPMS